MAYTQEQRTGRIQVEVENSRRSSSPPPCRNLKQLLLSMQNSSLGFKAVSIGLITEADCTFESICGLYPTLDAIFWVCVFTKETWTSNLFNYVLSSEICFFFICTYSHNNILLLRLWFYWNDDALLLKLLLKCWIFFSSYYYVVKILDECCVCVKNPLIRLPHVHATKHNSSQYVRCRLSNNVSTRHVSWHTRLPNNCNCMSCLKGEQPEQGPNTPLTTHKPALRLRFRKRTDSWHSWQAVMCLRANEVYFVPYKIIKKPLNWVRQDIKWMQA